MLSAIALATEFPEEESVLVLDASNFDDAIAEHDNLLVEFYAPWCGHCKRLAPEYAKAAATLLKEDPPIRIAKVDAAEERSLAEKFGVQGFPTLKFFRGGKPTEYSGGRQEPEISNWVIKKSGPAAKTITTSAELDALKEAHDVVVVGNFEDASSAAAQEFMKAAAGNDDVTFAITSEAEVASALELTADGVVLFKQFDEGRVAFDGELTATAIGEFVAGNQLPLVIEFSQQMAPKIFGGAIKVHMLLFVDDDDEKFEELKDQLRTVGEKVRGQALAIYVTPEHSRVMEYFGLSENDLPSFVLVNLPADAAMKKYMFTGELNSDSISAFVDQYFAGELKPFLKSEEIPEENDEAVRTLVGKNFESVAFDESKDVLVEFYAPWCGHCKSLAPKYEELAERLAGNENLIIAKMDSTANEVDHPDINIRGFPTLKFFPAGSKRVVDYDGEREVDGFLAFLKKEATNEIQEGAHEEL